LDALFHTFPSASLQPEERCPAEVAAEAAALHKLAALRQPQTPQQQRRSSKAPAADALPCRVAEGLYLGGAAAARNLKALRKRGITAIVNSSPSLPCYFKDNPEGCFDYLVVPLFDDPEAGGCWPLLLLPAVHLPVLALRGCWCCTLHSACLCWRGALCAVAAPATHPDRWLPAFSSCSRTADLLVHVGAASAFIAAAHERGGAVLVHCYAGQSRSAALVIAHLISSQRLSLMDAWVATRAARPCIQPNPGVQAAASAP
jgi:hypothetical protein